MEKKILCIPKREYIENLVRKYNPNNKEENSQEQIYPKYIPIQYLIHVHHIKN